MNTQELSKQENDLLSLVRNIPGSMDETAQKLEELGVFGSYIRIHKEYTSLSVDGDLEALKRATFIQWYSVSEPSCFTGIPGSNPWSNDFRLDKEAEKQVLSLVHQLVLSEKIDNEFRGMLTWYYQISDYYFNSFWDDPAILTKLREFSQDYELAEFLKDFTDKSLVDRGQMGVYWLSILAKYNAG